MIKKMLIGLLIVVIIPLGYSKITQEDTGITLRGNLNTEVVILIPGYGGNTSQLNYLAWHLRKEGYEVLKPDLGEVRGDLDYYGTKVRKFIEDSNKDSVTIIGYSAGGLIARSTLKDLKIRKKVSRVITIATPHKGSDIAKLGALFGGSLCSKACQQMAPGSKFLKSLPLPKSDKTVRWLSLRTNNDEVVQPPTSSILRNSYNIDLTNDCKLENIDHEEIVNNENTLKLILSYLHGEEPKC